MVIPTWVMLLNPFGKHIKQLDWMCPSGWGFLKNRGQAVHTCAAQHAGSTAMQDVLTCRKWSWRLFTEILAAALLEIFSKQKEPEKSRSCMGALSPSVIASTLRHSDTHPHTQITLLFSLPLISMKNQIWVSWEAYMCFLTLTQVSLPSPGKLTNLLHAMCNVCAHKLGMLLLTTLQMGHISRTSFSGFCHRFLCFCHRLLCSWFRLLSAHTISALRVPKRLTVANCHRKKKLMSSEQHPMTWSRSHCAQASCKVSCPCSLLLQPDIPSYQLGEKSAGAMPVLSCMSSLLL